MGREKESENTTSEFGFRKYDEETGSFMQPDPLWAAFPDQSPYQYGYNSPIVNSDASGLMTETVFSSGTPCLGCDPSSPSPYDQIEGAIQAAQDLYNSANRNGSWASGNGSSGNGSNNRRSEDVLAKSDVRGGNKTGGGRSKPKPPELPEPGPFPVDWPRYYPKPIIVTPSTAPSIPDLGPFSRSWERDRNDGTPDNSNPNRSPQGGGGSYEINGVTVQPYDPSSRPTTTPSPCLINNSDNSVYIKMEEGDDVFEVKPGQKVMEPIDGVATSLFRNAVFKVPGKTNYVGPWGIIFVTVTVQKDENVDYHYVSPLAPLILWGFETFNDYRWGWITSPWTGLGAVARQIGKNSLGGN